MRVVSIVKQGGLLCLLGCFAFGCSAAPGQEAGDQAAAPPLSKHADRLVEGEHFASPPLQATLLTPADGKLRDSVEVEITNISAVERDVWPELSAGGLADVQTMRSYAGRVLAPGETTVLRIPARDLPLRTAVIPITTVLSVGYAGDASHSGNLVVGDLITRFDADLTQVAVSERSAAGFERTVNLAAAKAGLVARVFDAETDAYVDLDESALDLQPEVQLVGESAEFDSVDELPEGAAGDAPSQDKAANTRFCARIRYGFDDAGYGEDRLTSWSNGIVNAAWVRVNVLRGSTMVFQGFLDGSGCTPSVSTPAGTYTVRVFSRAGRDGKELWAYDDEWDTSLASFSSNVSVTASTSSTLTVTPPVSFDYGAFLAFASNALNVFSESITGAKITFFINQNCDGSPACADASGNWLKLGSSTAGRFITQKFVVGHELGHVVQRRTWGLLSSSYNGAENPPFCACDHVDVQATNKLHCLQSLEEVTAAQNEGFGHFYAARLFNVSSAGSNCTFIHAKEFLDLDGTVLSPPILIDCARTWAWNADICGGDILTTGVELDWLAFYWRLTTRGSAFSFPVLSLLYRRACAPSCNSDAACPTACQGKRINGPSLEAAAANMWGFGSVQHGHVATQVWENL